MPETLPPEVQQEAENFRWDPEPAPEMEQARVDMEKVQMDRVLDAALAGRKVEVESLSPYLKNQKGFAEGKMDEKLNDEDARGLAIQKMLNEALPEASAVSLYDEYNTPEGMEGDFTEAQKQDFLVSFKERLAREGTQINEFISESEKVQDAPKLVEKLKSLTRPDGKSVIKEKGQAIYFNDGQSSGGDFDGHFFPLRTKGGRWRAKRLMRHPF